MPIKRKRGNRTLAGSKRMVVKKGGRKEGKEGRNGREERKEGMEGRKEER